MNRYQRPISASGPKLQGFNIGRDSHEILQFLTKIEATIVLKAE